MVCLPLILAITCSGTAYSGSSPRPGLSIHSLELEISCSLGGVCVAPFVTVCCEGLVVNIVCTISGSAYNGSGGTFTLPPTLSLCDTTSSLLVCVFCGDSLTSTNKLSTFCTLLLGLLLLCSIIGFCSSHCLS